MVVHHELPIVHDHGARLMMRAMGEWFGFGWELHEDHGMLVLRRRPLYVWLVVIMPLLSLVWVRYSDTMLSAHWPPTMILFFIIGVPLTTLFNLIDALWWSPVYFDRARNQVRRRSRLVGPLQELVALQPGQRRDAALELVFRTVAGQERTWAVSRLARPSAHRYGPELAHQLRVPWRDPF